MNLSDMLKTREIQRVEPDIKFAKNLLLAAADAISAAEDNVKIKHNDVALTLAYTSMLNAGMALMAAKGYRGHSESQHKTVVSFCAAVLPTEASQLVNAFNRFRVRRHNIVYGEIQRGSVGTSEAESAISKAKDFLNIIRSKIS